MLKSALVALDGSEASEVAQAFAIDFARRFNCRLEGLGIVDVPTIEAGGLAPIGGAMFKHARDEALISDARGKVTSFLGAFDTACTDAGVSHFIEDREGLPYTVIDRQARAHDLIIIGRDTRFHFETDDRKRETLGRLLRDSARPLIAIPRQRATGKATLIATDDRSPSARSVQLFAQLGLYVDQPVYVLSVDKHPEEASRRCHVSAEYLRLHGYEAKELPITASGGPEDIILKEIQGNDVGLVVMGTDGGHGLKDLIFGSTTSEVLRETTVPIFIHH